MFVSFFETLQFWTTFVRGMPRQRLWPWDSNRSSRSKYEDELRTIPYIRIKQFVLSHVDEQELKAAGIMPYGGPTGMMFASKLELCSFADREGIDLALLIEQVEEEAKPLPAGWFKASDDSDGLAYYWYEAPDGSTATTQWTRPTLSVTEVLSELRIQQKAAEEDAAANEIQRAATNYVEQRRRVAWEAKKQRFIQSIMASVHALAEQCGGALRQASASVAESASAAGKDLARSVKACVPASAEAFATVVDASKPCLASFAGRCVQGYYPHRDSYSPLFSPYSAVACGLCVCSAPLSSQRPPFDSL